MKKIPILMLVLILILIHLSSAGCYHAFGYNRVLRLSDGKVIPFSQMIEEARKSSIVFVGETHGTMEHHRAQLQVIRSLRESGVKLSVGLEMFRAESQKELDLWSQGKLEVDEFLPIFHKNWKSPWPWYRNIFLYSRDNRIPMIGLNVPEEITRKVSRNGFSSLSGEDLKKLPQGISCDIDDAYMDFIRRTHEDHPAGNKTLFQNFCEAQMVWDKSMAWHLIEFLKKHPERTVVVLSGVGHSWKRGIPEQVRRQAPYRYTVILPEIPHRVDQGTTTPKDADYILLY